MLGAQKKLALHTDHIIKLSRQYLNETLLLILVCDAGNIQGRGKSNLCLLELSDQ